MFVDEARKRLDPMNLLNCNPGECHPNIFVAQEHPEFEAGPLRAAVLEDETEYVNAMSDGRMPYLLIVLKYQPITSLTCDWDKFMAAFFALFYCHAMLWSVGIEHDALSEDKLLWNPDDRKPKLCDFDLSHFCEPPQIEVSEKGPDVPKGLSNAGTWTFMADELLSGDAMKGTVKRVYRHEVEAFVTVLVWIICRYKDGKLRPERPLKDWNQGNYLVVKDERARTFDDITTRMYHGTYGLPTSLWIFVRAAISGMSGHKSDLATLKAKWCQFENFPNRHFAPTETLEDFDDLRALHKMLSWPFFTHPSAEPFIKLMKEHILYPDKQQETRT